MRLSRGRAAVPSILLASSLVLAGCSSFSGSADEDPNASAAPTTAAEPEVDELELVDCNEQIQPLIADLPGSDRDMSFSCDFSYDVPISYDEPDGATLPLPVIRVVAAGQTERIGSLVVNPGGPGVSGVEAAVSFALTLPEEILQRFDIVGFDPRGVGLSEAAVECIPDDLKEELVASEPRPVTDEQIDEAFALTDEVADGCAEEYGNALGTFNTVDTARDMDRLREALGDEQLTYLGYSYGTTLGSTYAELFPDNVRAMVLDAAVDPDSDPVANAEARAAALEAGFDAFAQNCVKLIAGCPIGGDPRKFVNDLMAGAARNPIPSTDPEDAADDRRATPGVIKVAIGAALYDPASWPQLAQSLAAASKGDSAGVFSLADAYSGRLEDGTYSNLFDANIAVNCADTEETVDEDQIRELASEWNEKYPLFGAGSAVGLYTCGTWEAERTPLPARDAEGSAPILVVGTSGDPLTPLPGAVDMAEDLDAGVLLTWQGRGHTAYPKTACVTRAVDAYLINLTAPLDGLTCPA